MGEEWPLPGRAIFQRILLVSLQWIGGFARGATPFANGPRHCGQLFTYAAQEAPRPSSAMDETADRQPRIKRNARELMLMHCGALNCVVSKAAWPLTMSTWCSIGLPPFLLQMERTV